MLSLVKVTSGSGTSSVGGSGKVAMVMARDSSAAGDSCHGGMFVSLQELCILLSPPSLEGLFVSGQ